MRNRRRIKRYRYGDGKFQGSKRMPLQKLYERDNGICAQCGFKVEWEEATRDHRIPKSKGGSDKESNLQLMCFRCNQIKADSVYV